MQKKILTYVLTILWGGVIIGLGLGITALNDYQATGHLIVLQEEVVTDIIYYTLVFVFVLSCSIHVSINHLFKKMNSVLTKLTAEAKGIELKSERHILRNHDIPEFEALIHAFDGMKEHYYRTTRKLAYQKSKAESVVNNLPDGIIIIDKEGYIIEENSHAMKYIDGLDVAQSNLSIHYVLREPLAKKMIEDALENKKYSSCEIIREDKILHLRIHPIARGQKNYGYMIMIVDITRTRQLEEIRYQFVSNVTHELKTPLTSIQGFVETLKEGALENPLVARRFLDIIDVEAKRLYRLIQDILVLSEIENMNQEVTGSVQLDEIVKGVYNMTEKEARDKGIMLRVETDLIVLKKVNADHLKQVLMNLVSNAIRYTDQGSIDIEIKENTNEVMMRIKDTGIGIPKESLERIFERFYRVDKSRSRKSGGTGLGLSITKHLVQLYKGRIDVESEEGKGTCFSVYLPKQRD